jgi:hypothetical protein
VGREKWSNRYQYFPSLGYAQAVHHKAGVSTFKQLARDLGQSQFRPFPKNWEMRQAQREGVFIALFVRDPIDRFLSLWRYVGEMDSPRRSKVEGPTFYRWYRRMGLPDPGQFDFDEFCDIVVRNHRKDEHTHLVHWQHRDEEGLIPEFVWPFERIGEGWRHIRSKVPRLPRRLPKANTTPTHKARELPDFVLDWLKPDIEFHREITEKWKDYHVGIFGTLVQNSSGAASANAE